MAGEVTIKIKDFKRWPVETPTGHQVTFETRIQGIQELVTIVYCVPFAQSEGLEPIHIVEVAYKAIRPRMRTEVQTLKAKDSLIGTTYVPPGGAL